MLVIYPTETFYALGCDATCTPSIQQLYQIKQRSQKQPLLVLVSSWEMLWQYAEKPCLQYQNILQNFWPGPLTAILFTQNNLSPALNIHSNKIGFRLTSCRVAQNLIQQKGIPLVGTSANLAHQPPVQTVQEAQVIFGQKVDQYIDGGKAPGGKPSTVIDFTDPQHLQMIREGTINFDKIKNVTF